jgi:hypothetical protein
VAGESTDTFEFAIYIDISFTVARVREAIQLIPELPGPPATKALAYAEKHLLLRYEPLLLLQASRKT